MFLDKTHIKHLVFTLFIMCAAVSLHGFSYQPTKRIERITISSEANYPPYCIIDNSGKPTGFSVELITAAAKAVNIEVEIRLGIWPFIKEELISGSIDALPIVGRTPEREGMIDFTFPYLSMEGAAFINKNNSSIKAPKDLSGKKILVMNSDNAEEYVRREGITDSITTTFSYQEAFKLLSNGGYDAVITQKVLGITILKELNIKNVEIANFPLPNFRVDYCFAVQKGNEELLSLLNEGLSIIIADKTYDKIYSKWLGPDSRYKITTKDFFKIALWIIIPFALIFSLASIIILRSEVRKRTALLRGEVESHIKTLKELTELKNNLEKIVDDRTKELESFTYSVSHDLRTPLRAISGFSKILTEDYGNLLDSEGKRVCKVIEDNTIKMSTLIDDLLRLSRLNRCELSIERLEMARIAEEAFLETTTELERSVVDFSIDDLPDSYGDKALIKQVFINLISNAVKFTKNHSNPFVKIRHQEIGGRAVFIVEDNGAGFDMRYYNKLFGVFQRLHSSREYEGTGVGLAIVKSVIVKHGGEVWAESEQNKGSKFYFSLK